jgi:16S rRNA (guanine(1405)-N(7))-methyltransferase
MENAINRVNLVVGDVLAKKELSNLNEDFVLEKVNIFLEKHKEIKKKLMQAEYSKFRRSREHEEIIKKIRTELREVYGVFIQEDYKKRFKLLDELKKNPSLENHNKILSLHKSSKERLPYYPVVYKKIFEITGCPKKIVDFACGLNPFSYPYLGCKPEYVACDIAEKDLDFIQDYFRIMKIGGSVKKVDLIVDDVSEITKGADLVLLLKTLDSLETIKWGNSEALLTKIKAKWVVVSFPTKSLGGKKTIKKEKRVWFERMASKLGYKTRNFETPCEIFYILRAQ